MWPHINAYSPTNCPPHGQWLSFPCCMIIAHSPTHSSSTHFATYPVPTIALSPEYSQWSFFYLFSLPSILHSFPVLTAISQLPIHCPPSLPTLILLLMVTHHYLLHSTHCSSTLLSILTLVFTITIYSSTFSPSMTISNSSLYYQLVPTPHYHHSPFVFLHLTFTSHSPLHCPHCEYTCLPKTPSPCILLLTP